METAWNTESQRCVQKAEKEWNLWAKGAKPPHQCTTFIHGIIESLGVEKTTEVIWSNHQPIINIIKNVEEKVNPTWALLGRCATTNGPERTTACGVPHFTLWIAMIELKGEPNLSSAKARSKTPRWQAQKTKKSHLKLHKQWLATTQRFITPWEECKAAQELFSCLFFQPKICSECTWRHEGHEDETQSVSVYNNCILSSWALVGPWQVGLTAIAQHPDEDKELLELRSPWVSCRNGSTPMPRLSIATIQAN